MKLEKYLLSFTIFTCGAIVMIFELVGSRVLGPYFGASLYVWTNLIGIILGSLCLGYYWGGKLADKTASLKSLSFIIFLAAIAIGLTVICKDLILLGFQMSINDVRLAAALAALILFAPASILLGMVSPYAVKLQMKELEKSGSTVGNLYAFSTAGSIIGTFLSGYYLIPYFGTNKLLIILSTALALISFLLNAKKFFIYKISIFLTLAISWYAVLLIYENGQASNFVDTDTAYNRVWIFDQKDPKSGRTKRIMDINTEVHSAMFLDSKELANEYTKYYHLGKHFDPDFQKTLMLGGAAYSFPKDFLRRYPEASIDVVEIDPKLTELAKKYFQLKDDPRLKIYHEDARVFLNRNKGKYDLIFGDAFGSSLSLPFQLTSREAIQKSYDALDKDGALILNLISAIEGEKGKFLRMQYAGYKEIFPQVYLFPTQNPEDAYEPQNIILVALKSETAPSFNSKDPELNAFLAKHWKKEISQDQKVFTDNHAPVEHYIRQALADR